MRYISCLGVLASTLLISSPAMAEVNGKWHVTGRMGDKPFAVDCQFIERDARLSGVCTDVSTGDKGKAGKSHVLSQGGVTGDDIRWTYATKVMIISVDIEFSGKMTGAHMAGTVTAKGRQGTFTAEKI